MTAAYFPSVHSEHIVKDHDGVTFTATVKTEGGRTWNYTGTISGSALAMIGGDRDLLEIFRDNRLKIAEKLGHAWRAQPESFRYELDSTNVREYGVFVNNG